MKSSANTDICAPLRKSEKIWRWTQTKSHVSQNLKTTQHLLHQSSIIHKTPVLVKKYKDWMLIKLGRILYYVSLGWQVCYALLHLNLFAFPTTKAERSRTGGCNGLRWKENNGRNCFLFFPSYESLRGPENTFYIRLWGLNSQPVFCKTRLFMLQNQERQQL